MRHRLDSLGQSVAESVRVRKIWVLAIYKVLICSLFLEIEDVLNAVAHLDSLFAAADHSLLDALDVDGC
jgi:hypothetical protein